MLKTFIVFLFYIVSFTATAAAENINPKLWQVQSIDTMKYSRDVARHMLSDHSFDKLIDTHISLIAQTGATHVAIGTPYDAEFIPILTRWVTSARRHGLKIWFRGNWSGWEGWFDYPRISRAEHLTKTAAFLRNNPLLFMSGDIFSACPECENGGPGDPRMTGDVAGFRLFMFDLYAVTKTEFSAQNKSIASNYFSMNGDVVRLIMDPATTEKLDGLIVVDHYVSTPEKFIADLKDYARLSGGKVVLGEFGAPLPDLHPGMNASQQAEWLSKALALMAESPEVVGMNYWVSFGGSTRLWEDNTTPRPAVKSLTDFYTLQPLLLAITNPLGEPIPEAKAVYLGRTFVADRSGRIIIPQISSSNTITLSADDYDSQTLSSTTLNSQKIIMIRKHPNLLYHFKLWFFKIFQRFTASY